MDPAIYDVLRSTDEHARFAVGNAREEDGYDVGWVGCRRCGEKNSKCHDAWFRGSSRSKEAA